MKLEVRDTGKGMPPEVMTHLFEPFFTTKEEGKGTGLGLSTVYGIVTQSGGYVLAESKAGEGAVFRVLLPVTTLSVDDEDADSREAAAPGRGTILLVDDEGGIKPGSAFLQKPVSPETLLAKVAEMLRAG